VPSIDYKPGLRCVEDERSCAEGGGKRDVNQSFTFMEGKGRSRALRQEGISQLYD